MDEPAAGEMTDPATLAIHADVGVDDTDDIAPPIHVTSTYDRSTQQARNYRRSEHATTERLEAVLGALEGGHAVCYPSGQSAVASLLRFLQPDRIALATDVYHGVRSLVTSEADRYTWDLVSTGDLSAGDVWWVETPSNPRCLITDIAATAEEAAAVGAILVVDATFASPVLQRSLALGAVYVVHSTTKFIGGHSDALGGVVVTADPGVAGALRFRRMQDGAAPGSLDVWLTLRGVRTLPLRVERQASTALRVARHLSAAASGTDVTRVWYPGLDDHPGHAIAVRQMAAFGGVVSFEMKDDARARTVVDRLRVFRKATSLGGVESLAEWRRSVNPDAPEGLIRLSVGLEAPEDLISDLDTAITAVVDLNGE